MNKYLLQFILQLTPLLLSAAIPDLAAEDKLLAMKQYAEALKGYISCARGYVFLRSAICAERLGDEAQRTKALRKLRALEPVGKEAEGASWAERLDASFAIGSDKSVIGANDLGMVNGWITFNVGKECQVRRAKLG